MFGSQKRKEAAALEAIRAELSAAELRSRAVLADALAKMELRVSRDVEERRRMQSVTESAVETLQSSLTNSSTEIARALGQVANMCAIVAERLDADRLERRAFTGGDRARRPPAGREARRTFADHRWDVLRDVGGPGRARNLDRRHQRRRRPRRAPHRRDVARDVTPGTDERAVDESARGSMRRSTRGCEPRS